MTIFLLAFAYSGLCHKNPVYSQLNSPHQDNIHPDSDPLKIELIQPRYKQAIFATQELDDIIFRIHSAISSSILQSLSLKVGIRSNKNIITNSTIENAPDGNMTIGIPVKKLPPGSYHVFAQVLGKKGQELYRTQTRFKKLPPHKGEVRFDRNMACLVDGQPFFVFGWFTGFRSQEWLKDYADQGYTTAGCYIYPNSNRYSNKELLDWLDYADRLGLKIILGLPLPIQESANNGKLITKQGKKLLRETVNIFKDHPALLAWYMADEPSGRGQLPARRLEEYRIVSQEDPYHPCINLNNRRHGIYKYKGSCDLLMPNVYPGFNQQGGARRITRPTEAMIACKRATKGKKPVWITPQGHIKRSADDRAPTYTELRNQAWQGIAHDAMGFMWYREIFLKHLVASKVGMPYLKQEIMSIQPAVRSKSDPGLLKAVSNGDNFSTGVKKVDNNLYIIVVNLDWDTKIGSFEVKGLDNHKLYVLSEGRSLTAKKGQFRDRFGAYEVHVYTTGEPLTELPTKYDVQALIQKEMKKRHKKGNLAYQTCEVSIEASDGRSTAYLNDGCMDGLVWPNRRGSETSKSQWVQLNFKDSKKIGRIIIYSKGWINNDTASLRDFKVRLKKDEGWVTVSKIENNHKSPVEIKLSTQKARSLHLDVGGINTKRLAIQEIEVYSN